jgi:hypothetical protein
MASKVLPDEVWIMVAQLLKIVDIEALSLVSAGCLVLTEYDSHAYSSDEPELALCAIYVPAALERSCSRSTGNISQHCSPTLYRDRVGGQPASAGSLLRAGGPRCIIKQHRIFHRA